MLDDLTGVAAAVADAPVALLAVVEAEGLIIASSQGLDPMPVAGRGSPHARCACMPVGGDALPFIPLGTFQDPGTALANAMHEWGVVEHVNLPVCSAAGHLLGVLAVGDRAPGGWSSRSLERLGGVARLAGGELERRFAAAGCDCPARTGTLDTEDPLVSELRYGRLIESLPAIVYIADLEPPYTVRYVNAAVEMLGYSREDMVGRSDGWSSALHPDDRARVLAWSESARQEGKLLECEYRVLAADGSVRWLHERSEVAHDADGRAIEWQGVIFDVTARRAAEEALRGSEERFRALSASPSLGIFESDADGQITYVNARAAELWELSVAEMIGHRWRERIDPEHRGPFLDAWAKALLCGRDYTTEYRLLLPGGGSRWVRGHATPRFDASGRMVGTVGTAEDVTERYEAERTMREGEERRRLALEAAGMVAWEMDVESGRIRVDSHPDTRDTLPTEMIAGLEEYSAFLMAVHPDDRERVEQAIADAVSRAAGFTVRYRVPGRDGGMLWCESTGRVAADARGGPARVIGVSVDVTRRAGLEAQLQQAQKMEAVGQLAGGVAHDFNNLLMVIATATIFARDELPSGSPVLEELAAIDEAAERAARLTRQLLAFSRKQILRPEVLDLNGIVKGMTPMLRRLIGEDINILKILAPELLPVMADPGQMEQVLANLVLNARDAMPHGGRLVIQTSDVEMTDQEAARRGVAIPPGRYARISVRDTGTGMDEATRTRVFEPFFTTKEPGKGTGLGLATVYGIVKQSGGFVWASSAPGQGSTFAIDLPVVATTGGARDEEGTAIAAGAAGAGTVLLVEDEPGVRNAVRRVLTHHGYTVLEASNGREALGIAGEPGTAIDLVLTDVVMPEMNGRDAVEQLRVNNPDLKALFMSGYTDDEILRRGLLSPGMVLLEKPVSATRLIEAVREVLDSRTVDTTPTIPA